MSRDKTPKEGIYDERVAPLMEQIISICEDADIAMFAHFGLDGPDGEHQACTTALEQGATKEREEVRRLANLYGLALTRAQVEAGMLRLLREAGL